MKKKGLIGYFVGVLFLLFLFVMLGNFTSAASNDKLNMSSPIRWGNYSATLNFSARTSALTNGSYKFNVTLYCNASGGSVVARAATDKVLTIANSSATQIVFENSSVRVSGLTDGRIYNCSVYSDNVTDQTWANTGILAASNITIDNTPPNVSSTLVGQVGYGNYSGTITFNVSVNDLTVGMGWVFFNITYSNGTQVNFSSATYSGGYYSLSINIATFQEDRYNVTIYANDTLNNLNKSIKIGYLTFDKTSPTGSLSCSPSQVHVGDIVSCSCSGSDTSSGVSSYGSNLNPSTKQTGTFTEYCTITDYAGNSVTVGGAYTVEMYGSNVVKPKPTTTPPVTTTSPEIRINKTQSWTKITPGVVEVMKDFNSDIGVKEIQIEVKNQAQNVEVSVIKYDSKPANVSVSKAGVYKYLQIEDKNLEQNLDKAIINIQVEKSWALANNLAKEDIALFRYSKVSQKWDELTTTLKEEDSTYYYYNVELTGFSYFAIAEKETQKGNALVWIIISLVVLVVLAGFLFFNKRKKK